MSAEHQNSKDNGHFSYYNLILSILVVSFIIYTLLTYFSGADAAGNHDMLSSKEIQGKEIWQKHNCYTCHQLYGLGGYLGPDLTNIISTEKKGEAYARAMIMSGVKQMPKFDLSLEEMNDLIAFLRYVDGTGKFPARDAEMTWYGSFRIKTANEE